MPATSLRLPAPDAQTPNALNNADDPVLPSIENGDIKGAIAQVAPFTGLSNAIIDAIAEQSDWRDYGVGQSVFSMGQFDGDEFYIIARGALRVSYVDPDTGAALVEEIHALSTFALELVYANADNPVLSRLAVTAGADLSLVAVSAEALRDLAGQRPTLMRKLANFFATELSNRRFSVVPPEAAPEQRVFAELAKYIERDGVTGDWRIARMPKHRELADRAGVDVEIAAAAVAQLIQDEIAQRDYPGLIVKNISRFNALTV